MATKWTSPTWRMPEESNQSKFENYSLSFDGSSNHIETNLTKSGTIAISCWFYTEDSSTQMAFFGAGTTNPYQIRNFGLQNGEYVVGVYTKDLTPNFKGIRNDTTAGSATYTTGQWTHFVGIIEQLTSTNANYYLYENGVLKVQANDGYREQTTYPFFLGAMNNFGTATQKFNGKIDQLAVFDYVPSQNQVNYLYNSGTPQNPMAISGNAPIAYYPLGGSSTGDAAVSSPSTLTVPNESVPSATVFDFIDGNDTFIDCGANENILDFSGNDYTVSAWVNWDGTGDSNQMIASVKSSGTAVDFALTIEQSSGKISYWNGSAYAQSNSAIPTGAWCMVTIIVKAGQKDFFINGVADGTPSQARSASATAGTKFLIGKSNYGSEFFNGKVSNLQIWNSTLSPSEITTLYNNGVPLLSGTQPQAANLKAWYKMGIDTSNWDGSNWVIGDSVSQFATAYSIPNTNNDNNASPYGSNSKLISGGSFLSVADSILAPSASVLSISCWVKLDNPDVNFYDNIISQVNGATAHSFRIMKWRNNGTGNWTFGTINFALYSNDTTAVNVNVDKAQFTPQANTWFNIICTYDGTTMRVFINNKLCGSGTSMSGDFAGNTNNRFIIGKNANSIYGALQGLVSNVQVWNSTLTGGDGLSIGDQGVGEIAQLYNNGTPLASSIPQTSSLLGWWKLESGLNDYSGNNKTLTAYGNEGGNANSISPIPSAISSLVSTLNGTSSGMTTANLVNSDLTRSIPYSSYSMNFDGDARVQLANATGLNFGTGDFTYSLWVNTVDNGNNYFFGNSTDASANNGTIAFGIHSANDPSWRIWVSGETIDGTLSVSDSWKHCVIRRTSGVINVFVNSVKDTSTGTLARSVTNVGNIRIGTFGAAEYINGEISNFAIWDSSLTEDQIITIYNGGVPNNISSLSPTLWYSLGGDSYYNGSSFICPDLSTGSNDGTSTGMGSTALLGIGPGSTGNGTATGMNIPANLQGNAPNSTKNAFSINMAADDKTSSVPDISS